MEASASTYGAIPMSGRIFMEKNILREGMRYHAMPFISEAGVQEMTTGVMFLSAAMAVAAAPCFRRGSSPGRERVPVPDSRDPQEIRNLVASRDGQIEVLEVYEGIAMVSRGDTVQKGDLLVSGAIPSEQVGTRYVASDARILARTWKTGTIEAKRVATAQWPTGRQQMRHTLLIGDFSINLYWNSGISMDEYVTLYREKYFTLPWGVTLPIGLRTQALCETATVSRVQSDEELEQLCLAKLQDVVDSLEVEQVLETTHQLEITSEGASLRFEVTCLESIAQPQPFTP